ncbi:MULTISPECIES: hypothetical protein [Priestia]|uniref:hypothetical protein n=1 Tax=Priestia TaxID=2800373 RepID=UPI001C8E2179|nr:MULTISPECIES: hypothetical protein [Priestia]MBX9988607.1 hypothetical protein [Priestia aryabhattai]MCY9017275.1 hypothetical protein [Priestia megaterium]
MNPLDKRKLLKEQFNRRKQERTKQKKEILSFKDLDIQFESETFEWYKNINGGAKCE